MFGNEKNSLLKKVINGLFKDHYNQFEAQINIPEAMLQFNNFGEKSISIKGDFEKVSGLYTGILDKINIKFFKYPTAYFIHCDLIDRNLNFFKNNENHFVNFTGATFA